MSWNRAIGGRAVVLTALSALAGCGGGAPSVSSSSAEATVHGVVSYKGKPVAEGQIRFDPANVRRKMARAASAPIGKDGSYTVKTLVGGNTVGFDLPTLAGQDPALLYATYQVEVARGDNTFNVDLSAPRQ